MKTELKKSTQKIVSAFAPVENPPELKVTPKSEEDIVDTLIIDTYEKDDEGNVRPVTKQIVTGKKNRKAYIESFSDDCGLENILQKIGQGAIAEDKYSILTNQKLGQVTDLRGFQGLTNLGDIDALYKKAEASFRAMDPELKKNMTFKEFCTKFTNQDLVDYVSKKTAPKEQLKEGE